MSEDVYYHIEDDIEKYPEALWYFIIGGRATGKTYSTLKYLVDTGQTFCFIKRTIEDVKKQCLPYPREDGKADNRESVSPFEPLNRDLNWNIRCYKASDSDIGYFYKCDELNYPVECVGCIIALSAVASVKGFNVMINGDIPNAIVFDEFIPQSWVRGTAKNGEQTLDLYMTLTRDAVIREMGDVKVYCLANATEANNPLMSEMRIVDTVEQMHKKKQEYYYNDGRYIMVHLLKDNPKFLEAMIKSKFAQSIAGTNYYRMAILNEFAMNDFSLVDSDYKINGCKPRFQIRFKEETWTYLEGASNKPDYITKRKVTVPKDMEIYDLNTEPAQGAFRTYILPAVYLQIISERVRFESYEIYSTLMEYMSRFPKSKIT